MQAEPTAARGAVEATWSVSLTLGLVLILGAFLGVLALGGLADARTPMVACMLIAGLGWALTIRAARDRQPGLAWIVVIAVALRLAALGAEPNLSDDVWRYVWEGQLVSEGISPYAQAPDAPGLEAQREALSRVYERMNNTDISAAYPPLTQAAVATVVAVVGHEAGPGGMRWFFSVADLLVLIPLLGLLRRRGLPTSLLVVWAWSPLVVWEFACSGHFDSLGILLLVVALWAFDGGRWARWLRAPLLAGAFLVKLLPVLAAPFLVGELVRRRDRGAGLRFALAFLAWIALGFAPLLLLEGGLGGLTSGVGEYGLRWESWNLAHRWIEPLFGVFGERNLGLADPRRLARLFGAGLAGLWMLLLLRRRVPALDATALSLGAFLILSPTLHPWYLTWILPFLVFLPGALVRPWIWLACVSPLLYWPLAGWQADAEWLEPVWSWPLVALPFFGLLASAWPVLAELLDASNEASRQADPPAQVPADSAAEQRGPDAPGG